MKAFARLALLVASLAPAGAAAATDPLAPPDLTRYLRWGPVRARPNVTLSNLGYDNNIFETSDQGERQGSWTATVSPRLEGLVLFGHRAFLTFDERLDYTAYASAGELNYLNHRGNARLTVPFRSVGVYAQGTLARAQDRSYGETATGELDQPLVRREQTVGAGVILALGWRTTVEVGGTRTGWTNTDPDYLGGGSDVGERLDRTEEGADLKAQYRLKGRTSVVLEALQRDVTFDNPLAGKDSAWHQVLPGLRFEPGGALSGSVRVGPASLDVEDPAKPDYDRIVGRADVTWRAGRTSVTVQGGRFLRFSAYETTPWYEETSREVRALRWINRSLGLEAGAGWGTLDFAGSDRTDDLSSWMLGARLKVFQNALGRRVEYTFSLRPWRRDSTVDSLDRSRTQVGFGVVAGY